MTLSLMFNFSQNPNVAFFFLFWCLFKTILKIFVIVKMSCECAIYAINLFDYAKIRYLIAKNLYKSEKNTGFFRLADSDSS